MRSCPTAQYYSEPTIDAQGVAEVADGALLQVLETKREDPTNWMRVVDVDSTQVGWVEETFLKTDCGLFTSHPLRGDRNVGGDETAYVA